MSYFSFSSEVEFSFSWFDKAEPKQSQYSKIVTKNTGTVKPELLYTHTFVNIYVEHWRCTTLLYNNDKVYISCAKIVSEYDQEIPQSQTADNTVKPRGRATQPSRDTRKTN